ncbi:hypothetical protein LTR62_007929 [Meristemomyces frigidus]|uniref:Uncharacterized protein n=1 Tax=Meristemomyces frigidus TaxID=1508187 RepID=A0AAN7YT17_9PEZI|nr:hypothetical protein LTR62_007929 [Meristemomyces frigidus]
MASRAWNPCSYLPRRLQIVASLTTFLLFCLLFLGTSSPDDPTTYVNSVPFGPELRTGAHQVVDRLPALPKVPYMAPPTWLNPFSSPAHTPPPEQANSSSGEARWYADFKWRNPFSSSTTLDEERAVLPPLVERPPVYTYFDAAGRRKDEKSRQAEQDLLQVWRRAWWAQGFKPVVLGKPEAMNNPLYRAVQGLELEAEMETELMRWLAWGNMGTGILANWLAIPMAAYDDAMLSFFRRGEYPLLVRYESLESGLFVGSKIWIEKAIKEAIANPSINTTKTFFEAVPPATFTVDKSNTAIAFYSTANLKAKYPSIREKLSSATQIADGLAMLPPLINAHLHSTWQNTFSTGIAILKPSPEKTTSLILPAIDLARNLSQCATSPIPASCPPNRPKCKPCVSSTHMPITVATVFRNTSTLFTIGTVPHPYTLISLLHSRSTLDVKFIRRETARDSWTLAATSELIGSGQSSFFRLPALKDAVASEYGRARSLWFTAERPPRGDSEKDAEELDWHFGFVIPREPLDDGRSVTPVPGPERRPPPPKDEFGDGPRPSSSDLKREIAFFEQARLFLQRSGRSSSSSLKKLAGGGGGKEEKAAVQTRGIVEAWNLADTEVWKFVRAWNARLRVERRGWEEEEEDFLGKGRFAKWVDRVI